MTQIKLMSSTCKCLINSNFRVLYKYFGVLYKYFGTVQVQVLFTGCTALWMPNAYVDLLIGPVLELYIINYTAFGN